MNNSLDDCLLPAKSAGSFRNSGRKTCGPTGGRDAVGTATPGMVERYGAGQTQAGMYRGSEQSEGDLPVITLKGLIYKKDKAGMAWVNAKEGTAGA